MPIPDGQASNTPQECQAVKLAISWIIAISVFCATYLISIRYREGLSEVPGPFWDSILPITRIWTVGRGLRHLVDLKYHQTYGPLVRVGPKHVSFSDGEAITQVYGIGSKFRKSDFYTLFDARTPLGDIPTTFSIRDEATHLSMKRRVANAFSMSTMLELEPLTDSCIQILEAKLIHLQDRDIDLGTWLHWYAFDVITSITFSNRLGFMEQEKDVGSIIAAIEGRLKYNSTIGQLPSLHQLLLGNRMIEYVAKCIPSIRRLSSARYIATFAARQVDRYRERGHLQIGYRDMLDRFRRLSSGDTDIMSEKELLSHTATNIFAGSDTTAISLRSMFYYLCKNPACYRKLRQEIDIKNAAGDLSDPIKFSESLNMPYLQACMKEAMRMHPAVGMLLERVVPEGGTTICGTRLPQGTIVGANPWVVARDQDVYGADSDTFRPERWITANPIRQKLMDRNFLAFGAGSRTCLGKNISLLEMNKVIPQILRKFDVRLASEDLEWRLHNYWFVNQSGLMCRFTQRTQTLTTL
jgi:hypothetical protein